MGNLLSRGTPWGAVTRAIIDWNYRGKYNRFWVGRQLLDRLVAGLGFSPKESRTYDLSRGEE